MYNWKSFNKPFRDTIKAFGGNDQQLDDLENLLFFEDPVKAKEYKLKFDTPEIPLPSGSKRLSNLDQHDKIESLQYKLFTEYLKERCIDPSSYDFYACQSEEFLTHLIIPFYRNGKIIYWQTRNVDKADKVRFKNPPDASREAVLFNYDNIYRSDLNALYVTEGVLDAISINGVCLLGSALNKTKEQLLKKHNNVVFVIDKNDAGLTLARNAVKKGFSITFFDCDCDDANAALIKYGKLWVVNHLKQNTKSGWEAELIIDYLGAINE